MGFLLEQDGAVPPTHPHMRCTGAADLSGRGWAWNDNPLRQKCFSSGEDIAAPAQLVAAAIGPSGLEAMLAIARLAEALPGKPHRAIFRIFSPECRACGGNHHERAAEILRSVKYIHPGAIESLRAACVPEYLLRRQCPCEKLRLLPKDPAELDAMTKDPVQGKRIRSILRLRNGLPVWKNDPERTRVVQIAFAHKYRLKKGS